MSVSPSNNASEDDSDSDRTDDSQEDVQSVIAVDKPRSHADNASSANPGRSMDLNNKLRRLVKKDPIPYEQLFPTIPQLLPGQDLPPAVDRSENDDRLREKIKQIEADTASLLERQRRIETLVETIKTGRDKTVIPELVSSLKEMASAASNVKGGAHSTRKVAFVGAQGVGKSFVENVMTLLGLGVSSTGLGTKAVVHYELRRTASVEKCTIFGEPVTYDQIYSKLQAKFAGMLEVENVKILVQIHAPWVPFQADYLDVPGISATVETEERKRVVLDIIRSLASSHENIDFVVVGDANCDPESVSNVVMKVLAEEKVEPSRIIAVLNKVNLLIRSNNSPEENKKRIASWENWFHQKPYLFAAGKKAEFDTIIKLPPQEQIERWKSVVDEGDKDILKYAAESLPDYPKDRLGIDQAVMQVKSKVINDIIAVVDDYISALRKHTSTDVNKHREQIIDENSLNEAFVIFSRDIRTLVKDVSGGMAGYALRVRDEGGQEFFETLEETNQRNQPCLHFFNYGPAVKPNEVETRSINFSTFQTAVSKEGKHFGTSIMQHDFIEHSKRILSWFIDFDEEELQKLVPNPRRDASQYSDEAISYGISYMAQQLQIREYLKDTIGRLACDVRRIYRVAFWVFQRNYANHKAMQVLLNAPGFRKHLQLFFNEALAKQVKDSQAFMECIFGEIIDARLKVTEPWLRRKELQVTFADLKDEESVNLNTPPSPVPLDHHNELNRKKDFESSWKDVYKYIRKAIKAHYSVRLVKAVDFFSNHFDSKWMNLDHLLIQWTGALESFGRPSVVECFELNSAVEEMSRIDKANATYQEAIIAALALVANNRESLKMHFDQYNPVRDYAFPEMNY